MALNKNEKLDLEKQVIHFMSDCTECYKDYVDIVSIARKKGFSVQRLNMGDNTTGMMLCDDNFFIAGTTTQRLIVVKKGLTEEQSRFIVAHELGHFAFKPTEKHRISHREYSSLRTNKEEQKADYFASALLMPKDQIIELIKKSGRQQSSERDIVLKISKAFKVSEAKAYNRLCDIKQLFSEEVI